MVAGDSSPCATADLGLWAGRFFFLTRDLEGLGDGEGGWNGTSGRFFIGGNGDSKGRCESMEAPLFDGAHWVPLIFEICHSPLWYLVL
jgi:hypothetical protein